MTPKCRWGYSGHNYRCIDTVTNAPVGVIEWGEGAYAAWAYTGVLTATAAMGPGLWKAGTIGMENTARSAGGQVRS